MKQTIAIIGAGVAGLTAALALEEKGYQTTIYDRNTFVGGRVTSEKVEGHTLDIGFQVLLTAYPLAQKYLDYSALGLNYFESGSKIVSRGKTYTIGDAARKTSFLWSTLMASIGTLGDKLLIYRLSKALKKKSIEAIFNTTETTTLQYLKDYGFSETIIRNFFQPFFGGIYLETALDTSSRMFEFIFKMFGEGQAAIPKKGIKAIPEQLAGKLKSSTIELNQEIHSVTGNTIQFINGETKDFDFIVVTNQAEKLISNLRGNHLDWKGTTTLYFEISKQELKERFIHLSANNGYINSISFPENNLISVSVVKPYDFEEPQLVELITKELDKDFNIQPIKFLKLYEIPKSLPILNDLKYSISPTETQLTEHIYLAGDQQLNGSLNAAMLSGELVAEAINEKITGTIVG